MPPLVLLGYQLLVVLLLSFHTFDDIMNLITIGVYRYERKGGINDAMKLVFYYAHCSPAILMKLVLKLLKVLLELFLLLFHIWPGSTFV